jgi:hypothetical protein
MSAIKVGDRRRMRMEAADGGRISDEDGQYCWGKARGTVSDCGKCADGCAVPIMGDGGGVVDISSAWQEQADSGTMRSVSIA